LYRQIKASITQALQASQWKPGEPIPSETELAARWQVSQGTVRKAIDELAAENLLVRRQGKGTFVATHAEPRTQYRFLRLTADSGNTEPLARRLLDCRQMRPGAEVVRALQLGPREQAIQVRRLLLAEGTPVVFDDIWLPAALFAGLTSARLQAWRAPMYALFETEFGVRMIRAEEQIRAVNAAEEEARLLEVPPATALLAVRRLSFTYDDKPVELRRGLYDTRAFHYRNSLS
jgi:GntR family transcriptional regulator